MSSERSVTLWIERLKAGDAGAARRLWERYFDRLLATSRHKLPGRVRRVADEEDVALIWAKWFKRCPENRVRG